MTRIQIEVIKEAIALIEKFPWDKNVEREQVNIIKRILRELQK